MVHSVNVFNDYIGVDDDDDDDNNNNNSINNKSYF